MDTPMLSDNGLIEQTLSLIKPEIRNMHGYTAPPQSKVTAKLNQNENPFDLPPSFKRAILSQMETDAWIRYPMFSPASLRERLAARFDVRAEQILLGNGSNQLLYLIASAVVTPGDKIIIPPPTFSLFDVAMTIVQGSLTLIPKNSDFSLNMERMYEQTADAKLIMLCSPDNPTGAVIPLEDLEILLRATRGIVFWDEAYAEFGGKTAIPLLDKYPNLIISRTFSKAFGLAGLRVGYLIGNARVIGELQKANIPYNINLFSLSVANHLLDNQEWVTERVRQIITERQKLFDQMVKIPQITPYTSQANFILFRVKDKPKVFMSLKNKGILVRDMGNTPPLDECLRVTIGAPEENEIFLNGLQNTLS